MSSRDLSLEDPMVSFGTSNDEELHANNGGLDPLHEDLTLAEVVTTPAGDPGTTSDAVDEVNEDPYLVESDSDSNGGWYEAGESSVLKQNHRALLADLDHRTHSARDLINKCPGCFRVHGTNPCPFLLWLRETGAGTLEGDHIKVEGDPEVDFLYSVHESISPEETWIRYEWNNFRLNRVPSTTNHRPWTYLARPSAVDRAYNFAGVPLGPWIRGNNVVPCGKPPRAFLQCPIGGWDERDVAVRRGLHPYGGPHGNLGVTPKWTSLGQ